MMIRILLLALSMLILLGIYMVRGNVIIGNPYGQTGPSDGAYLIVEPRAHHMLSTVIKEFSRVVPEEWTLYVAHGQNNAEYAREAASIVSDSRRIVFIPLKTGNLQAHQYNKLLKDPDFWSCIDAEHILVFQTDARPCGKKLDMDRFGSFGYIGCAYGNKAGEDTGYWGTNKFYGVGGLSLRKKSFMLKCLGKPHTHDAEDVTSSNCVDENAPTAGDIGDFCAQNSWGPSTTPNSWGSHKIELMPAKRRRKFLRYCNPSSSS